VASSVARTSQARWSIGAGLGHPSIPIILSSAGYGSNGVAPAYGSYAPSASTMLERVITRRLALMVRGSAKVNLTSQGEASLGDPSSQALDLSVQGGPRWLVNPDGPVEVSIYGLLSTGLSRWQFSSPYDPDQSLTSRSYSVGADLGLVTERELMDDLYLRFQSSVLRSGYTWAEAPEYSGDPAQPRLGVASGFSAGVALSPSVELRLAF